MPATVGTISSRNPQPTYNDDTNQIGPSASNCLKRTHGNSKRSSPTGEASTSKRARRAGSSYTYADLGDCNERCRHCEASFWYGERLSIFATEHRQSDSTCNEENMEVNKEVLTEEDMGAAGERGTRTRIMVVFWFLIFL
nr:poly [ADP-ribose] polymerase 1 [Tanacetum cinerariifolium]